jgi:aryl-alcohol dehydrogenase-like predicted oxidoreductase
MELCLGTVQFGMDYGIRGGKKPLKADIYKILDYARESRITMLDTASGYGDAQSVLGKYMINNPGSFEIISKLSRDLFTNLTSPRDYLEAAFQDTETTLKQLWIPYLKGILFHNPKHLNDKNAVAALKELKKSGYTEGIGVSVYEPEEAAHALELGMDFVQLPVNLFDHRFDEIVQQCDSSVKILARSVYLQGLLLMDITEVHNKFPSAEAIIEKFNQLCEGYGYSRRDIALAYLKKKSRINSIILGVDNMEQLQENITAYQGTVPEEIIEKIAEQFENVNENIVSPIKWR